jgi:outer membrane lipoprotein SlyB
MLRNRGIIVLLLVALFGLNACVAPPPRERVVYRDPASQGYEQPSGRYCHSCGTIRGIDQVQISQQTTGGGAILGAIIGGVIGNQFGRGGGRAAATAVGAVGGAVVGNNVEEGNARAASGYAWRFYVELDDGRTANVTQYDNNGYRVGDRVIVRGGRGDGHIELMRQ